jgi:hypothetical protein
MCPGDDGSESPTSNLLSWKELVALAGGPEQLLRQVPRIFQIQPASVVLQSEPADDGWKGSVWNCVLSLREYVDGELKRDVRVTVPLRGPNFVADGLPETFELYVPPEFSTAPFEDFRINARIEGGEGDEENPFKVTLTGSASLADADEPLQDTRTLLGLPNLENLFASTPGTPGQPPGVSIELQCLPVTTTDGVTKNFCHQRLCYSDGLCGNWQLIPGTEGCPNCS